MRTTLTHFFLSVSNAEAHTNRQTYQNSKTGLNTSGHTPLKSGSKCLPVILIGLITMMISSAMAQPGGPMVAGTYTLTGSITWYDSGGQGGGACPGAVAGNYANNLNITETMTANPGQRIVVTWTGGQFGLSTGDVLTVYDGPSTGSPVLASYTNTSIPIPALLGATTTNSITFRFTSDTTNTCKGWQATVAAYYFIQPGSFTFSCSGTYTFVDPQNVGSGGPGGDATCIFSGGNSKDYRDTTNIIESFSTANNQCIKVDGSFPSNFGICAGDTLKVFDGPSTLSPLVAAYTNTFNNPGIVSTSGSSVTFQFISDLTNHSRGWQFSLSCMSPPTAVNAAITPNGPTTFCHGDSVVLTVASPGFSYQWKKGNTIQPGATQQSFIATHSGNYKCVVSNSCGSITSNTISVTQNPLPTSFVSQAPCINASVLLTCAFTPSTGVTFKWKKGGVVISGATDSTYSATQSATYRCVVTITATGCTKKSAGSNVMITCKLSDVVTDNKLIVYPNPSSDYFNISTAQLEPQSVIYIYDLTGRLVESHKVSGGEMKAGETLSNGIYFLKIASDNEVQQVIKLVKNF